MPITPVPSPLPSRTMDQDAFDAAMANLMIYIPLMMADNVAMQEDVMAKQSIASTAAATATEQVALATEQVELATEQAVIATDKAALTALDRTQTGLDAAAAAQKLIDIAALYDQFDDRYLGVKAADPTLDNDGNALASGAFYISSVSGFLRGYTATFGWVQGISAIAGVASINGLDGPVSLKTLNGNDLTGTGDLVISSGNSKPYFFGSM